MPGSGVYRGTDKADCQPTTRGVQRKALFERTQGEVQDGALDGNRGEEPAGERKIPAVHGRHAHTRMVQNEVSGTQRKAGYKPHPKRREQTEKRIEDIKRNRK